MYRKTCRGFRRRRNRTIGRLRKEIVTMKNYLISAPEVVELMGVSESMAYRIIKKCNEELAKKGYITVRGKTPKAYLLERMAVNEVVASD